MMIQLLPTITALVGCWSSVNAYYLPGANPRSYTADSPLMLKVNKLTSTHSLYPRDYYSLPFCRPPRIEQEGENLGEFLAGDKIENSPYTLKMMKDVYCQEVCTANLGRGEHRGTSPNKAVAAIRQEYHNNWIVDGLNAASKTEDEKTISTNYHEGFLIGFVADDNLKAYIHNHVNIEIMVNKMSDNQYRVVRFTVEPFSIKHDFDPIVDETTNEITDFRIINPIKSCDKTIAEKDREHTSYAMVTEDTREPQEASGKVLFTYDVIWTETTEVTWASRWNIYLDMKRSVPSNIRWFSIVRKMIIVLILSAMVAAILVRNLRRDINRYNTLATEEEKAEELEEYGWKLVHADVFRPPSFAPMFLAICCGTGAQLLGATLFTIIFSSMGFMSPARRGHLLIAELILFVLFGALGGYVMARLYKTFKGKSWQTATFCMALGYPGLAFFVFSIINIVAISQKSTDAVPFVTILVLMILWLGISTPMVFLGAYFGYKQDAIDFPVNNSTLPRQVPDQPWFLWVFCTAFICGILPYGSCVVELQLILSAMWQETYYYVFGFLLVVYLMLLITCAEITVLFTYFQLCNENYHWWWRSFINGGAAAVWVFLYSITFFRALENVKETNSIETNTSVATYVLYFGYMALVCAGLFTITGAVGMGTSLWFNKTIFASIKID